MEKKPVSVFGFTDYQLYLNTWFEQQKSQKPHFSFQFFAQKAGFKSRSYMQFVLKGQRPLSVKTIPKAVRGLGLNKKETQYFEALVLFKECKDNQAKIRYWEQIKKLGKGSEAVRLSSRKFDFFRHWYIAPIRELICNIDFKNDYGFLSRQLTPAISARQARSAVELLLKLKMVQKKGKIYEQSDLHLKTSELMQSVAVRNFQKKVIELGGEALERFRPEERNVSTMTLSTTMEGYEKIQKLLGAFQEDIIKIVEEYEDVEKIFQFNFQLFPLSRLIGK